MKYDDLILAHDKYGTNKEDIVKRLGYDRISSYVVIAPWWKHTIFENHNLQIEQITDKLYHITGENIEFSFLELQMIGASAVLEAILPLGLTKCKKLLFIGSAGALSEEIAIGDIVIPNYSICGDGASRYLNTNLEDEFLKKEYPYGKFVDEVVNCCERIYGKSTILPNYSVDTIFAQFHAISMILETGAKTIEMETAAVFKASQLMQIPTAALFVISDNTITNKSLYSGRSQKEQEYRHYIRNTMIPNIIIDLLEEK